MQCCDLDTLTTSLKGELKHHSYFSPRLVATSNLRRDLPSLTEHHLFNHTRRSYMHVQSLRHNNVASHCYLDSQKHDAYIVMLSYVSGHIDYPGLLNFVEDSNFLLMFTILNHTCSLHSDAALTFTFPLILNPLHHHFHFLSPTLLVHPI